MQYLLLASRRQRAGLGGAHTQLGLHLLRLRGPAQHCTYRTLWQVRVCMTTEDVEEATPITNLEQLTDKCRVKVLSCTPPACLPACLHDHDACVLTVCWYLGSSPPHGSRA